MRFSGASRLSTQLGSLTLSEARPFLHGPRAGCGEPEEYGSHPRARPEGGPEMANAAPLPDDHARVVRTADGTMAITAPDGSTVPLSSLFGTDNAVDLVPWQRVRYRMRPRAHPIGARPIRTGDGQLEVIIFDSSSEEE